ncbi:hypothetical protein [Marinobacter sp. BGYM27]|uniref:hypothetical protein n=1 Tax=Marinobacter sp. BGYM27 TaxID=2975597 RepID=UPI0021A7651A|nr:hypothetical protein [Marinobacter sp. BGYM27]MDG5500887.1 hypothetical protein [Marinobacter sp. BGYM27]
MNYKFYINEANFPVCEVFGANSVGDFISSELAPSRIKEIDAAIKEVESGIQKAIEVERDDLVLTFYPNHSVELDYFNWGLWRR